MDFSLVKSPTRTQVSAAVLVAGAHGRVPAQRGDRVWRKPVQLAKSLPRPDRNETFIDI